MKKRILSSVIASALAIGIAAPVSADNSYQIRIFTKAQLSDWTGAAPIYHPWTNTSSHYDCEIWSPNVNTINFGTTFNQSRECSQDQSRDVEIREKDSFSGVVKTVNTVQEQQTVSRTENQNAIGTLRNWVSHESTYTDWEDFGVDHSHSAWSPTPNSQTADFTQSRDFKHDQEQFEQKREFDTVTTDIRNTGSPIRHTQSVDRDESRPVDVDVTAWSNVGSHYDCDTWSPSVSSVDVYQSFTQYRDCSQNQTRRWSYDASGSEIHSRMQNQTITETESQSAIGVSREWVATTSTYTDWADSGAHHTFGSWSPVPTNQTVAYTQTRSVKQPQEREEQKREIDNVSGEYRDIGSPITHNRDINESETRSVSVTWSAWVDTTKDSYSTWTPAPANQTANYTQSRTYSQNQTRNRIYKAEGATIKTVAETQSVTSQVENRSVIVASGAWADTSKSGYSSWSPAASAQTSTFTQTRSYTQNQARTWTYSISGSQVHSSVETRGVTGQSESRTVSVSGSGWVHDSYHSYGSYSPAKSTVCSGDSFTQTRSYKQKQKYTYTYSIGGTYVKYQDVNKSQSRGATGTKTCENWIEASSSKGSWYNTSGTNCGSYSPSSSTVNLGQSFTQYKSCSISQEREISTRQYDTISGNYRITGSYNESRVYSYESPRQSTGTKDYVVNSYWGSWGSWRNTGGAYNWSGWSHWCSQYPYGTPTIWTSRTYSQDQVSYRYYWNIYASGASQSTSSQSRSQTVTLTYIDATYDCSSLWN